MSLVLLMSDEMRFMQTLRSYIKLLHAPQRMNPFSFRSVPLIHKTFLKGLLHLLIAVKFVKASHGPQKINPVEFDYHTIFSRAPLLPVKNILFGDMIACCMMVQADCHEIC